MTYGHIDILTYQDILRCIRYIRQDIETYTVYRDILYISDIRISGQADKLTPGHQNRHRVSLRYPGTLA